jgi:hypothetical protein
MTETQFLNRLPKPPGYLPGLYPKPSTRTAVPGIAAAFLSRCRILFHCTRQEQGVFRNKIAIFLPTSISCRCTALVRGQPLSALCPPHAESSKNSPCAPLLVTVSIAARLDSALGLLTSVTRHRDPLKDVQQPAHVYGRLIDDERRPSSSRNPRASGCQSCRARS